MKDQAAENLSVMYDAGFHEWTHHTAELIRQGRFEEVDARNVAEEIRDMGRRNHREVKSRTIVWIMHRLKWRLQPALRDKSGWAATIAEQRRELQLPMADSPSPRRIPVTEMTRSHALAVKDAVRETCIPALEFPPRCPFTHEEALDDDFWPG